MLDFGDLERNPGQESDDVNLTVRYLQFGETRFSKQLCKVREFAVVSQFQL